MLKDSYILDVNDLIFEQANELPQQDMFTSSSALFNGEDLYVVGGKNNNVFKYDIIEDEWKITYKFGDPDLVNTTDNQSTSTLSMIGSSLTKFNILMWKLYNEF